MTNLNSLSWKKHHYMSLRSLTGWWPRELHIADLVKCLHVVPIRLSLAYFVKCNPHVTKCLKYLRKSAKCRYVKYCIIYIQVPKNGL